MKFDSSVRMNPSKRLLVPKNEFGDDNSPVKRFKRKGTPKYSNVIVRVGPEAEEYAFGLLVLLVSHSSYFKRRIEATSDEEKDESTLVIDLPDFPYGQDIFRMVQDFCCNGMDESDISTANVVKLFRASEFLEMETLKLRVSQFLNEKVFLSWESCLEVLATFDSSELPEIGDDTEEDNLFETCKKAFLFKIEISLSYPNRRLYDMNSLLKVAKLLPEVVAQRIYQSVEAEQSGCHLLLFLGGIASIGRVIFVKYLCYLMDIEPLRPNVFYVTSPPKDTSLLVSWIEELPKALPDLSKRSLFMMYLAKLLHVETYVTGPTRSVQNIPWDLEFSFVCGLLVQATELAIVALGGEKSSIAPGLVQEIGYLEKSVSQGLQDGLRGQFRNSAHQQDQIIGLLTKFKSGTLLSIVRHFRSLNPDQLTILRVARILDACLAQRLKGKSFTGKQTFLIYQEFPNDARPSHTELYHVLVNAWSRNDLSSQEALELTSLLDYDKLSDEIIEKLFEEFHLDCGPQFVNRFVAMQQAKQSALQIERKKCDEEFSNLRTALNVQAAELFKVSECKQELQKRLDELFNRVLEMEQMTILERDKTNQELNDLRSQVNMKTQELIAAGDRQKLAETERDSLIEVKRMVESERDAQKEHKKLAENQLDAICQDLEKEKEKTTHLLAMLQEHKNLAENQLDAICQDLEKEKEKTSHVLDRLQDMTCQLDAKRHDLEEEKEKTTCQICFVRRRDALCMPCLHFLYCFNCVEQHLEKNAGRTCPTCRCFTSGVLKCHLSG